MTNFLLEIGTEEMPADFSQQVINQLSQKVAVDLERLQLQHGIIHSTSTPRRIVLIIEELAEFSSDLVSECKGPPLNQAFIDGVPTQAANGFAKRNGLEPKDLEIRDTPKGSFVFAKNIEKGKPTLNLLSELIPNWIDALEGKRFMRWGEGDRRFSRPIRWMVSMLGEKIVPFNLKGCDPSIKTSNVTRGLRIKDDYLSLGSANDYSEIHMNTGIIIDRKSRKSFIKNLINEGSKKYKAIPDIPSKLIEELTDLVENPSLIIGEFDCSYLSLPPEVLTTVMKVHQRYVPLYKSQKDEIDSLLLDSEATLYPQFLCISNGPIEANNRIKKGNERVLKARLADAKFFVESDLSISSVKRLDQLKEVAFSAGLGSLFDRVKRIEWIVKFLIKEIDGPIINEESLTRAALLCKHDLVSQMVGEFPELEGVIGGKYLLYENEDRQVALAVSEHYLPRGSGDPIPQSDSGSMLALAERLELLLSIFSKGNRPSGSSDPYALRRAGNGIVQILFAKSWSFDVNFALIKLIEYWSDIFPDFKIDRQNLLADLSDFFRQRIISQLDEYKIDSDLIQAVAGNTIPIDRLLSDPADIRLRAELLSELRTSGKLSLIQSVVTRASRLAEKSELTKQVYSAENNVSEALFEKDSEKEVFNLINSIEPIVTRKSSDRYLELAKKLSTGSDVLAMFFDGNQSVMVMTEDLDVRSNRLNLLKILKNQSSVLADFDQILS